MIFHYLAVGALLTLTTQAGWENGTWIPPSNCETAANLATANATGSTSFTGVIFDQSTGKISSTPSSNWSLIVSLTERVGSPNNKQGDIYYWIDTSSTIDTNATTLPYDACVVVWIGASERGDVCLRPNCLEALTRQYQAAASQIPEQMRQKNAAYMDAQSVCANLLSTDAPEECEDPSSRFSIAPSLNPISALNCTPSLPTTPRPLPGTSYLADSATNYKLYDYQLSATSPFIITLWSNRTTLTALGFEDGGPSWAETRIGCIGPDTVIAGSRDPATAEAGGKLWPWTRATVGLVVWLGVLVSSLTFV